jgi:hypothetical protein
MYGLINRYNRHASQLLISLYGRYTDLRRI